MIELRLYRKILITGGTSGLGLELAKKFLNDGSEVYVTGRQNPESIAGISNFHFIGVDFSSMGQVRECIKGVLTDGLCFDLVICNAGILSPSEYTVTPDGFEYTTQVNFLCHLLICEQIVKKHGKDTMISFAFVTSPVFKYVNPSFRLPEQSAFKSFRVYSETKYYLLLTGSYLKRKYPDCKIRIIGLNPGTFSSQIYRMQKKWFHLMYRIAAPFMRSSVKVAEEFHRILLDGKYRENKIWHRSGRRSDAYPEISEKSESFLLACQDAIEVVR
jgi:NAD(P)-dependent dehydrogenase (short-subunit alcohol dehydrogenase family)